MADEAQLKVRLLRSLKAKVDAAAHENRRTINAEIVARIERTFVEDAERMKVGAVTVLPSLSERVMDHENRLAVIEQTIGMTEIEAGEAGRGASLNLLAGGFREAD